MSWLLIIFVIGAVLYWDAGKKKRDERAEKRNEYYGKLKAMRVDNPDHPYELSEEASNE